MGYSLKENSDKTRFDSRWTRQWNLHHSDDHGEFSHLLTSINLMIITKRENHTH